ncbi:MAG TPA: NAD(P)H-dependent glycerol-3-phosphate dehydrogenase [Gemmatimonadales bacterium]|nr:NAD(P)H-dependent glycerol-3-phosphate dehydrogenase [Gemmatimonadales bacterium]
MTRVTVVGAGSWGTALADLLASKGVATTLWAHESEVAESVGQRHENQLYFAGRKLDERLTATSDLAEALSGCDVVVSVTPSHVARPVWRKVAPHLRQGTPLVCATKGIEPESLQLMHEVASEELPQAVFVALSGPSFADEVHERQPTAVVVASHDDATASRIQELFSTTDFRLYTSRDVTGVELAGSLKNVIAIAAGVLDGLGLGHNPRAALLTRGLAEIARLGEAMGAEAATFAGLAGMGDLILTCTGGLSRNRQLGIALAKGETLEHHRATHRTVAEGVNAALGAARLAARYGVEMPITEQVKAVLFDGASPSEGIRVLMERTPKAESMR